MDETAQLVEDFESFLKTQGLTLQKRWSHGDNMALEYGTDNFKVMIVLDRRVWSIRVADPTHFSTFNGGLKFPRLDWYDVALISEFLGEPRGDALSLAKQIEAARSLWPAIIAAFAPENKDKTHAQLAALRDARFKRR